MPDFSITVYQGQDIIGSQQPRLHDLLGKRPLVLNLWASECKACIAEMPTFQKVHERYKDQVLFVGLDVGQFFGLGDEEGAKRTLKRLGITYVAIGATSAQAVLDLGAYTLPTTLFVTADGMIQQRWLGAMDEAKLTQLVEDLLKAR